MKKIIVSIVAFVYLSASMGATVHFHYCMDKLVNARLWHSDSKKCGNCGMDMSFEKNKNCCKDAHKQYKLENDHKGTPAYQLTELVAVFLPVARCEVPDIKLSSVTEQNPLSHAPPRIGDLAIFILNRVFRI